MTYMYHEVSCEHQIREILAIVIGGCYYSHVNDAVHGLNSTKVCNPILVHRVVIDTTFIGWRQAWWRILDVRIGL